MAALPCPLIPYPSHPTNPQPITGRFVEVLLERRAAEVGELGEGAPQVMRGDPAEAGLTRIPHDRLEDTLRGDRTVPDASALRHAPHSIRTGMRLRQGPGAENGGYVNC